MDLTPSSHKLHESGILAYGTASKFRNPLIWIGGFFAVFLLLVAAVAWSVLNRSLAIPAQTALLVTVIPKTSSALLPDSLANQLPALWRSAISGRSHLPVVLGAYRTETGWQHFAIIPSWRTREMPTDSRVIQKTWMFAVISDEYFPLEKKDFRLATQLSPFSLWADPRLLFTHDEQQTDSDLPGLAPFSAQIKANAIYTSVPFQAQTNDSSFVIPSSADVNLRVPGIGDAAWLTSAIMDSLRVNGIPLPHNLPALTSLHQWMDDQLKPTYTSLSFEESLNTEQRADILAGFGLTNHRVIQLADGSLAVEQTPWQATASSTDPSSSPRFGFLKIEDTQFSVGDASGTNSLPIQPVCPAGTTLWARFSSRVTNAILKSLSITLDQAPAIQLGSKNGLLIICRE